MIRSWQSWFGRAIGVLGLLLVAQLVFAGEACAWASSPEAAVVQEACEREIARSDVCVAPQRFDASISAAVSLPPDPPPGAGAPRHASAIPLAAVQPRFSAGLTPGSPSPVYIRFGRFLA